MLDTTECPRCHRTALEHIHSFTNAKSIYCDACGFVQEAPRQDDGQPFQAAAETTRG